MRGFIVFSSLESFLIRELGFFGVRCRFSVKWSIVFFFVLGDRVNFILSVSLIVVFVRIVK